MARTGVKASTRFEVLKRDSFTCQYCGRKAPDVVLEVDHVVAVANGGTSDILNLVTACRECNGGKSSKPLSESAVVSKAMSQACDMNERRQQLEMIAEWHRGLLRDNDHAVDLLESLWVQAFEVDGLRLTDAGRDELRRVLKTFGFDVACQGLSLAVNSFRKRPQDQQFDEDRNVAFWSIGRMCSVVRAEQDSPGVGRLFYIRGILKKRCQYLNAVACISLLKEAMAAGVSIDAMEDMAKQASSWSGYRDWLNAAVSSSYDSDPQEWK